MNVLVTGGSGFIGGNLTDKLVYNNFYVKCLVRSSSNTDLLDNLNVHKIIGDLTDYESLLESTKDIDYVYHCAALVSDYGLYRDFYETNVLGTKQLLDACIENNVKRFIHVSTTDVVWNYEDNIDVDETKRYPTKFKHPYCETKAQAEKVVIDYNNKYKLNTVIIRPCLVWGPGDLVVLPKLVELALNKQLFLIGDGTNIISMSYIDNLSSAIIKTSLNDKAYGNIYFINDGININFSEYLDKLMKTLQIEWDPIRIPYKIAYIVAILSETYTKLTNRNNPPFITKYAVAALGRNLIYSTNKAKNELNYKPEISLEQGMINLKAWVDQIGGINQLINAN